jgi:hypothetical protein
MFNVRPVTVLGQLKVVGSERLGPLSENIEQMSYSNEASLCQSKATKCGHYIIIRRQMNM